MLIVDKNKDYYDYLSHIYSVDKKIVYDRRGSENITDESIYNIIQYYFNSFLYNKKEYFVLLEIGNVQYLIEIYNIKFYDIHLNDDKFKSFKMKVRYIFRNHEHYFDVPISIREVKVNYVGWGKRKKFVINNNFNETITSISEVHIDNPILKDTQITSLIDANEIWKELQNYISSLNNDQKSETEMTDVERAELHGFDKKISFRHPIK